MEGSEEAKHPSSVSILRCFNGLMKYGTAEHVLIRDHIMKNCQRCLDRLVELKPALDLWRK